MSEIQYETLREIKAMDLESNHITHHVDKKFITFERDGNECYYIDKARLLTEEQRLKWVAHMGQKNWIDNYKFCKTMIKAIKVMNLS